MATPAEWLDVAEDEARAEVVATDETPAETETPWDTEAPADTAAPADDCSQYPTKKKDEPLRPDAKTSTTYSYTNYSLSFVGTLMVSGGQVCYQSLGEPTKWHGSWSVDGNECSLRFNYRGDTKKLRSAYLFRTSDTTWEGRDYKHRKIKLEKLDVWVQDITNNVWMLVTE